MIQLGNYLVDEDLSQKRENLLISSLGESTNKTLAEMPKVRGFFSFNDVAPEWMRGLSEEKQQAFTNNLGEVLEKDPSTNLVLLRKAYEDKGVDWKEFKNSMDSMIAEGKFKPSDDQLKALDILTQPPLDRLDKILFSLKLTGR